MNTMNLRDKMAGELDDPVLAEALKHFKASVDAWSEARYSRSRASAPAARFAAPRRRLGLVWALGCVVAAGSLAGGVFEHHQRQEMARAEAQKSAQKAAQQAELDRLAAEEAAAAKAALQQRASERASTATASSAASAGDPDKDLMAKVDSDVSQQVPAAMEPLAQLMDDSGTN